MKAIMVMYDSLNRHFLPNYGCDWTITPNFKRLGEQTVTFDTSYVCSMPCMPARRDFQTGRPNFLHCSWGPMQPFDDSVPEILQKHGVQSHMITDHYHYFEDGGSTYHSRYTTWQAIRGQEGDPWIGQVAEPPIPENINKKGRRSDWVNRQFLNKESDYPQSQTFEQSLDFIDRNKDDDNWFLHIETFDPHEPFEVPQDYKDQYELNDPVLFDWPGYQPVSESPEEIEQCRRTYASLLTMCDKKLGMVLDKMDQYDLWKDTMLILWTDHGYFLGEKDMWAKNWMPLYDEVARTPFFVWDPRSGVKGERRQAVVQPALDLGPTLLEFFGIAPTDDMLGKNLAPVITDDTPIRDAAIFGYHGQAVNITDGNYVYMRNSVSGDNSPVYEYTLMPTRMRGFVDNETMKTAEMAGPFSFTKGMQVMKIGDGKHRWESKAHPTQLFDMQNDPDQQNPINDPQVEQRMIELLKNHMQQNDAPQEQYERLGL